MIQGAGGVTSCTFGEGCPPWLVVLSLGLGAGGDSWGAPEGDRWDVTHGLVTSRCSRFISRAESGVIQADLAASPGALVGCSPLAAPALGTLRWGSPSLCQLPPCLICCLFGACWRILGDRPELQGVEEAAVGIWGRCGVRGQVLLWQWEPAFPWSHHGRPALPQDDVLNVVVLHGDAKV